MAAISTPARRKRRSTTQSATNLAILLRAGALPAPLNIIEERTVGAELGAVLETLEYLKRETSVWFEITTLLIPDENDSDAELAYISVSTMMPAEVCEYPDSGKIGAFGGEGPGRLRHMTPAAGGVDYWKDEV